MPSRGVHTMKAPFTYRNLKTWRSFISAVRPTCTNPSRKRSISKTLFKSEEFENAGLLFYCGRKIFWPDIFSENDDVTIITWFPCSSFSQKQSKLTGDCCGFEFLQSSLEGKHLMLCHSLKPLFSTEFRRGSTIGFTVYEEVAWSAQNWKIMWENKIYLNWYLDFNFYYIADLFCGKELLISILNIQLLSLNSGWTSFSKIW